MTLFVPTVYVLPSEIGFRLEWHVFVATFSGRCEEDIHYTLIRRRYGQRMPWTITRAATCGVAKRNIQSLAHECDWSETPAAVRDMVLQDLGLA